MLTDYIACRITGNPALIVAWLKDNATTPWAVKNYAPGRETRTHKCGDITLYTDAPNSNGIRLEVKGQGCRQLEQLPGFTDWQSFLGMLLDAGARFTRFDIALDDKAWDDKDGLLNMDTIFACCHEKRVVSRYKQIHPVKPLDGATSKIIGRQVTFGVRPSETLIRIYDKALQMKTVGIETPEHWVRVELETRNKKAQALAEKIVESGGSSVPQLILGLLKFKASGRSKRRDRLPIAGWWTSFLGTDRSSRLEVAPSNPALAAKLAWLFRSGAPIFAMAYDAGGGEALVQEMLREGRQRLERGRRQCAPSGPIFRGREL